MYSNNLNLDRTTGLQLLASNTISDSVLGRVRARLLLQRFELGLERLELLHQLHGHTPTVHGRLWREI